LRVAADAQELRSCVQSLKGFTRQRWRVAFRPHHAPAGVHRPDLLQYDEVRAAAGTWTHVFGIEPHRLVEASEGLATDLKRD